MNTKVAIRSAVVLVLLLCLVWAFTSISGYKDLSDPARARAKGLPMPVRTATIELKHFDDLIGATGITEPSNSVPIRIEEGPDFEKGGLVLKEKHVIEGQRITAGELLFALDPEIYELRVEAAVADLAAANKGLLLAEEVLVNNVKLRDLQLNSAKAELQFRTDDLNRREADVQRFSTLKQAGTIATIEFTRFVSEAFEARFMRTVAVQSLESAELNISTGKLQDEEQHALAIANLARARQSLHTARHNLARTRLTSPIDGLVDRVEVVAGQFILHSEPLTTIHRIDPLHMRVDFPPERAHLLRTGKEMEMTVNVQLDNRPQEPLNAKVVHVGPVVSSRTRTLPVTVAIDNSDGMALPGVGGFARFQFKRSAILIPTLAVIERDSRAIVFTIEGETARIREIELGPTVDVGYREVLSGLSPGEKVVIFGQETLNDGDQVNEDWKGWARRDE